MRGQGRLTSLAALALASFALTAPSADADPSEFGLASVSASLSSTRAGAHPDFGTTFEVKTEPGSEPNAFGLKKPYATTRDVVISLPPGLLGNPNAVTQCAVAELATWNFEGGGCPTASQVGISKVYAYALTKRFNEPLYLLTPPADGSAAARLGLIAGVVPTIIDVQVRSESDYGVDANLEDASGLQQLVKAETAVWGFPAAKSHDTERQTSLEAFEGAEGSPSRPLLGGTPAPFLTNSTRCGVPSAVDFSVDSYSFPGVFSRLDAPLPPLTGCDLVGFSPSLAVEPTSRQAGEPTGLDAELTLPQDETVSGVATAPVRSAIVTLPQGVTIASGAADGLAACSAEEVGFGRRESSHCPAAAKIGNAEIDTPLLSRPLHGSIYQRSPESEHLFRIWLVADELGLHLKLSGEVHVDEVTGQITSSFEGPSATEGLPQAPVRRFTLHFREGARAPLANPPACGTYHTASSFIPWSSSKAIENESPMTIDEGCGRGAFSPKLSGGTINPVAGAFSGFVTTLVRESDEQNVSTLDVALPSGVLAKLAGVQLCEGPAADAGDCPPGSRIGSAIVASGPGPAPLWLPQPGKDPITVYLSGPYKGAPYSLVVRAPAEAGPFDLGTVVTRAGIYVDPETARATVRSDPLPQILKGVPISYRTISVDVDRPEFALNPTSCREKQIEARVGSIGGSTAAPVSRFQVGGCGELPFKPALSIRLFGRANRGAHPRLTATLRARPGDANIGRAQVALPSSEFLEQGHIQTICTRVQFAADQCPEGSIYGHARAVTPLLDRPLEGPVYLRSSSHELPDLVIALRGQVELDLVGRIDSIHRGIRTTFETVPDAPVTSFTLSMEGGAKSLLANSTNLCASAHRAQVQLLGQNGRRDTFAPVVKSPCGAKAHKRHR